MLTNEDTEGPGAVYVHLGSFHAKRRLKLQVQLWSVGSVGMPNLDFGINLQHTPAY
jgi:hypothetical protein